MNRSLELLTPAVAELLAEYQASESTILSGLSLDQYHAAEECFTQQLVSFTKKQFFEVALLFSFASDDCLFGF